MEFSAKTRIACPQPRKPGDGDFLRMSSSSENLASSGEMRVNSSLGAERKSIGSPLMLEGGIKHASSTGKSFSAALITGSGMQAPIQQLSLGDLDTGLEELTEIMCSVVSSGISASSVTSPSATAGAQGAPGVGVAAGVVGGISNGENSYIDMMPILGVSPGPDRYSLRFSGNVEEEYYSGYSVTSSMVCRAQNPMILNTPFLPDNCLRPERVLAAEHSVQNYLTSAVLTTKVASPTLRHRSRSVSGGVYF